VEFNLDLIVGEWTGFYLDWLVERIFETHHYRCPVPARILTIGGKNCAPPLNLPKKHTEKTWTNKLKLIPQQHLKKSPSLWNKL